MNDQRVSSMSSGLVSNLKGHRIQSSVQSPR